MKWRLMRDNGSSIPIESFYRKRTLINNAHTALTIFTMGMVVSLITGMGLQRVLNNKAVKQCNHLLAIQSEEPSHTLTLVNTILGDAYECVRTFPKEV
jgi:hypothetical protein